MYIKIMLVCKNLKINSNNDCGFKIFENVLKM